MHERTALKLVLNNFMFGFIFEKYANYIRSLIYFFSPTKLAYAECLFYKFIRRANPRNLYHFAWKQLFSSNTFFLCCFFRWASHCNAASSTCIPPLTTVKGQSTRCNSVPCYTASMAHLLHMAHLILSRREDSSYGCNTVPMWHSVFVCPWSGNVCMMTEVEEDALLTIIIVCVMKNSDEIVELLGISTSYELQKKWVYIGQLCWIKK